MRSVTWMCEFGRRSIGGASPTALIRGVGIACALSAALALGCAPRQMVPLQVGPQPVRVFLDGEAVVGPLPESLDLVSDRGHVVFVKRDGYQAQQVVLRSVPGETGPPRLVPDQIVVELVPATPKNRRIEVELDDSPVP